MKESEMTLEQELREWADTLIHYQQDIPIRLKIEYLLDKYKNLRKSRSETGVLETSEAKCNSSARDY
jgi:hypothetical protein